MVFRLVVERVIFSAQAPFWTKLKGLHSDLSVDVQLSCVCPPLLAEFHNLVEDVGEAAVEGGGAGERQQPLLTDLDQHCQQHSVDESNQGPAGGVQFQPQIMSGSKWSHQSGKMSIFN